MEAIEFIKKIDWNELRIQKANLIHILEEKTEYTDSSERKAYYSIYGILNLIDSIQDYAVDVMNIPEKEVLNLTENEFTDETNF
jgi:cytidylate kinase